MSERTNRLAFSESSIAEARSTVANSLGAHSEELAFVPNTTVGLNAALGGLGFRAGSSLVIPEREYNGIQSLACALSMQGVTIITSPVDASGRIDLLQLRARLEKRPTGLVFSWVDYSTGAMADIDEIGSMCARNGVRCIVDAMQALGMIERRLSSLPVDAVACGAHKGLLAPPGIGVLWISKEVLPVLRPSFGGRGTFTTESGVGGVYKPGACRLEYGNLNQIGVAMLAETCARLAETGLAEVERRITTLCTSLYEALSVLKLPFATPNRSQERMHIVSVDCGGRAGAIARHLAAHRVAFSQHGNRLRFSVGIVNDTEDLERLARILSRVP
jgi:selenocysteine lyase/cysteine desulfurase